MKHFLSILLICSIGLTQELTVDGNLNVTGNIQNQTIDSLLQVIQDLQSQIGSIPLIHSKVYELGNVNLEVVNGNPIVHEFSIDIPQNSLILSLDCQFTGSGGGTQGRYYYVSLNGNNLGQQYLIPRTLIHEHQQSSGGGSLVPNTQSSLSSGWSDTIIEPIFRSRNYWNNSIPSGRFYGTSSPPIAIKDNLTTFKLEVGYHVSIHSNYVLDDFKLKIFYVPIYMEN